MTRTELIKVRVTPRLKGIVVKLADNDRSTVSNLVRDLLNQLASGRSISPEVRADMAIARQLGNLVFACAEAVAATETEIARKLVEIGERLRALASRHLGPSS